MMMNRMFTCSGLLILLGLFGCGAGGVVPVSVAGQMSSVTLLFASSANERIAEYSILMNSVSLTNTSGKSVSVFNRSEHVEFVHSNNGIEPFLTSPVPQDVYTSATVTYGSSEFTSVEKDPNGALRYNKFERYNEQR